MSSASLISIVTKPQNASAEAMAYMRVPAESALLEVGHGIKGDVKGSTGSRQINIMSAEVVRQLADEGYNTVPGALGEQLVIDGIHLEPLQPGTLIKIGSEAVIEVVKLRTGCSKFERYQGRPQSETVGRLGIMARVKTGGAIKVGDAVVEVASPQQALPIDL
jgi:MOSC domain-containing protein YiiM